MGGRDRQNCALSSSIRTQHGNCVRVRRSEVRKLRKRSITSLAYIIATCALLRSSYISTLPHSLPSCANVADVARLLTFVTQQPMHNSRDSSEQHSAVNPHHSWSSSVHGSIRPSCHSPPPCRRVCRVGSGCARCAHLSTSLHVRYVKHATHHAHAPPHPLPLQPSDHRRPPLAPYPRPRPRPMYGRPHHSRRHLRLLRFRCPCCLGSGSVLCARITTRAAV